MSLIRRALLSVSDKTGLVELARGLADLGVELLSTGGTARALSAAGLAVREVADVTGFPEMLDGRVKTLHPAIHGGILARRDLAAHGEALARHGIAPIDLVAVNLYPFEATAAKPGVGFEDAIEQIDVGGPAMIRAAAKNHEGVVVLVDPGQYAPVLEELQRSGGAVSVDTRRRLALEAFRRTAQYDAAIAAWLRAPAAPVVPAAGDALRFPPVIHLTQSACPRSATARIRISERPSTVRWGPRSGPAASARSASFHGPELSYNNLLDLSGPLGLLLEFDEPAAVVVKHTNPCGAALGPAVGEACSSARGLRSRLDLRRHRRGQPPAGSAVVEALAGIFVEILFAPAYAPDALDELRRTKRKLRVLELPSCGSAGRGAARVPERARRPPRPGGGSGRPRSGQPSGVVSRRQPTAGEWPRLRFAWRVAKHVKSNAIVLATGDQVIGVGAGQMNRVDSARLAVMRARELGHKSAGRGGASDAFFPFRDGLDVVGGAGATAVIHPGGLGPRRGDRGGG